MSTEIKKVKPDSEMDADTFLKHLNARHVPIGRMTHVGKSNIPGDENESLLRTYHHKIHEHGADHMGTKEVPCNHTHRDIEEMP